MSLTLARARVLTAVVETGSFSAAARALGQSQASVSQQLRDLEAAFGVVLVERRGRDMVPTALCQQLHAISRRMLANEAEAVNLLLSHRDLQEGELRIGLGNAMPGMALIGRFQRAFPTISLEIEMGSWGKITEAVTEGRVHLGILPDVPDDARFRREPCMSQRVVAVVPPAHPLAGRARLNCGQLMSERLIFRTRGSSAQRIVDTAFRRAGLAPQPAIRLDTRDGVLDAVANDLGIGFAWNRGTSRRDGFVTIRCDGMDAERTDWLFAQRQARSQLTELFFRLALG